MQNFNKEEEERNIGCCSLILRSSFADGSLKVWYGRAEKAGRNGTSGTGGTSETGGTGETGGRNEKAGRAERAERNGKNGDDL